MTRAGLRLRVRSDAAHGRRRMLGDTEMQAVSNRTCEQCGERFAVAKSWQRFCSGACKVRAFRARVATSDQTNDEGDRKMELDITKIAGLARMGLNDAQIAQVLSVVQAGAERTNDAAVRSAAQKAASAEPPKLPLVEPRVALSLEPTKLRVALMKALNARAMTSRDLGVLMFGSASTANTKRIVDVAYALRLRELVQSDWSDGFARHLYQITDKGRAWLAKAEREAARTK